MAQRQIFYQIVAVKKIGADSASLPFRCQEIGCHADELGRPAGPAGKGNDEPGPAGRSRAAADLQRAVCPGVKAHLSCRARTENGGKLLAGPERGRALIRPDVDLLETPGFAYPAKDPHLVGACQKRALEIAERQERLEAAHGKAVVD